MTKFEELVIWLLVHIYRAVSKDYQLPPDASEKDRLRDAWARDNRDYFWNMYAKEMGKHDDSEN